MVLRERPSPNAPKRDHVQEVFRSARIKPAAVQVEAHPYFPQTEILEFCNSNGLVMEAFAPLGHGIKPAVLSGSHDH
jgi:diketogulonate reductase-like aldo/keto reductase